MKRLVSLALILCILFTCAAPVFAAQSKSAPRFSDAARIRNYAECALLTDLGVLSGNTNGAFEPNRNLTRAEVAVMACRLLGLTSGSKPLAAADVYSDHWAASYIACALELELMTLRDDGRFLPNLAVNVRDFCRVLLRLLGYEDVNDDRIEALIAETDLLNGYSSGLDSFVSRDDACLLLCNAASGYQIERWEDGEPIYYTDAMLNPTSLLERRFGLTRYTERLVANEYANLLLSGNRLDAGISQLAEHRPFAVSSGLELVGRRVDIYVKDGKVVGLPLLRTDETCVRFDHYLDYEACLLSGEFEVSDQTSYFLNYEADDRYCMVGDYDRCTITCVDADNDGVFDLVLVLACEEATFTSAAPVRLEFADGRKEMITAEHVIYGDVEVGDTVYAVRVSGLWHIYAEE